MKIRLALLAPLALSILFLADSQSEILAPVCADESDPLLGLLKKRGITSDAERRKIVSAIARGCEALTRTQAEDGAWRIQTWRRSHEVAATTALACCALRDSGRAPSRTSWNRGIAYLKASGRKGSVGRSVGSALVVQALSHAGVSRAELRPIVDSIFAGQDAASGMWGYELPPRSKGKRYESPEADREVWTPIAPNMYQTFECVRALVSVRPALDWRKPAGRLMRQMCDGATAEGRWTYLFRKGGTQPSAHFMGIYVYASAQAQTESGLTKELRKRCTKTFGHARKLLSKLEQAHVKDFAREVPCDQGADVKSSYLTTLLLCRAAEAADANRAGWQRSFRAIAKRLVELQRKDGLWRTRNGEPVLSTIYAIRILSGDSGSRNSSIWFPSAGDAKSSDSDQKK